MSEIAVDFEHIRRYVGEDPDIMQEVFSLFKNQIDMWSRGLDPVADDEAWAAIMHSLKGSARAIGAKRLAELCEHGEGLIGENNGAVRRKAHIDEVRGEIDQALIEIGRWEYRQTLASMRS